MDGPIKFFFTDSGLQVYEHYRLNKDVDLVLPKLIGPDKIKHIDLYLDTFNIIFLKEEISNKIKEDFTNFTNPLNKLDMKKFLINSFYFRGDVYTLKEILVFGTSLVNPLLNLEYELPMLVFRYHEAKIEKYTGMSLKEFMSISKSEQDTIFNTVINIVAQDNAKLNEVVDELNLDNKE